LKANLSFSGDFMVRVFVVACALSCLAASAWAQGQPASGSASVAKKPEPKSVTAGKPTRYESGPCGLGVIVAVGDEFEVQRIGFASVEHAEIPIGNWDLGDLIYSRVRAAAAPGVAVRRIFYSEATFPKHEEPKGLLFRDLKAELMDRMRQITSGSNCQRYVVVGRSIGQFGGGGRTVRGIGVVKWFNPLRSHPYLYALTFIRVFDGRDLSIIRQGSAIDELEPLAARMLLGTLLLGPHRELGEGAFPSVPAEAATNPTFREGVRSMLKASLDKTLSRMLRP
jgi:hypothetical protein